MNTVPSSSQVVRCFIDAILAIFKHIFGPRARFSVRPSSAVDPLLPCAGVATHVLGARAEPQCRCDQLSPESDGGVDGV